LYIALKRFISTLQKYLPPFAYLKWRTKDLFCALSSLIPWLFFSAYHGCELVF